LALACKPRDLGLIPGQSHNRELHCQELIYKKSMTYTSWYNNNNQNCAVAYTAFCMLELNVSR